MHPECLPPEAREVLAGIKRVVKEHGFILAGGTGLALHIGHRLSVDLDFFTGKAFIPDSLFRELGKKGFALTVLQEDKDTLVLSANGAKVSFFRYPYSFVDKKTLHGGINVAGILDIASMKVMAIAQRGAKRDFVDLYFILKSIPFRDVAGNMIKRFGKERINPVNIGKALIYFKDADSDPDPLFKGRNRVSWDSVKKFYARNFQQMTLDLHKAVSG